MTGKRKRCSAEFKARAALDALRGELTTAQLATRHGMHQTRVSEWKTQAMEGMAAVFSAQCGALARGKEAAQDVARSSEAGVEKLHAKTGQRVVERDFWAKASGRRAWSGGGKGLSRSTPACLCCASASWCRSAGQGSTTSLWVRHRSTSC